MTKAQIDNKDICSYEEISEILPFTHVQYAIISMEKMRIEGKERILENEAAAVIGRNSVTELK